MSPSGDESGDGGYRRAIKEAGPYLTLGLELGLTMIVWSLIGYLLDMWLGTLPWLTLAGVLVGMISLFIQLIRVAKSSGGKPGNGSSAP